MTPTNPASPLNPDALDRLAELLAKRDAAVAAFDAVPRGEATIHLWAPLEEARRLLAWGAVSALPALLAMARDSARMDWLEQFAVDEGGLTLHTAGRDLDSAYSGLAFRSALVNRTLREAIDAARSNEP